MLSFFRSNQAQAGLLLLVYAFLLQLPALLGGAVAPVVVEDSGGYFGNWMMALVGGNHWLGLLIPVILIFVLGIQANLLATRHRLSRAVTQFPGLFIVLIWGLVPTFRWLHPVQVANIFLLFGLISVGRLYQKDEPAIPLFNAGAWLGLAFLFQSDYLLFGLAFLAAITVLRKPEFRRFLQFLTGFAAVCFFATVWAYFNGIAPAFWATQWNGLGFISLSPLPMFDAIPLALLALILLFLSLFFGSITRLLNMEGKKGVTVIYWFLLCTIPTVLLGGPLAVPALALFIIPIGILFGLAIIDVDSARAEVLHLFLFVAALASGMASWLYP